MVEKHGSICCKKISEHSCFYKQVSKCLRKSGDKAFQNLEFHLGLPFSLISAADLSVHFLSTLVSVIKKNCFCTLASLINLVYSLQALRLPW